MSIKFGLIDLGVRREIKRIPKPIWISASERSRSITQDGLPLLAKLLTIIPHFMLAQKIRNKLQDEARPYCQEYKDKLMDIYWGYPSQHSEAQTKVLDVLRPRTRGSFLDIRPARSRLPAVPVSGLESELALSPGLTRLELHPLFFLLSFLSLP
ncbi:hypothetical protein RRG08_059358 [Elysia crispata]|uniref:Uncharacterized protein n=1 Tax=Elysia crispata TaxID=231223 RepID=A0AAE1EGQ9_9GAST|nr:hypothetical protein RRG08_059358 [Elysia crispata]